MNDIYDLLQQITNIFFILIKKKKLCQVPRVPLLPSLQIARADELASHFFHMYTRGHDVKIESSNYLQTSHFYRTIEKLDIFNAYTYKNFKQ